MMICDERKKEAFRRAWAESEKKMMLSVKENYAWKWAFLMNNLLVIMFQIVLSVRKKWSETKLCSVAVANAALQQFCVQPLTLIFSRVR